MVNKGLTCSRCRQHGYVDLYQSRYFSLLTFYGQTSCQGLPQPRSKGDCSNGSAESSYKYSNPSPYLFILPSGCKCDNIYTAYLNTHSRKHQRPLFIDFQMPHCEVTFPFGSFKQGFVEPGETAIFRRGAYCFQSGAFAEGAIGPGGTLIFEGGKYTFKDSFLALGALGPGSTLYFESYDIYFHRGALGADDFSKGNCNLIFHNIDQHTALGAFLSGEPPAAVSVFFPTRETDFPVERFPALKPRLNNGRTSAGILKRKAESPDSIRTKASLREAAEESRVARQERGTRPNSSGAPPTEPRKRYGVATANDGSTSSLTHASRVALLPKPTNSSKSQAATLAAGKPRDDFYRPSSSSVAVVPSADCYRPTDSSDIVPVSP